MAKTLKKDKEEKPKAKTKKLSKKELKQLEKEVAEREAAEKLQAERTELLKLSEKELLVEILLAVRGYDERISSLEKKVGNAERSANIAALGSASANLNTVHFK